MSLCKYFNIKPICMIYEDVSKHAIHTNISINSCEFNNATNIYSDKVKNTQPKAEIDPLTGKAKVDMNCQIEPG